MTTALAPDLSAEEKAAVEQELDQLRAGAMLDLRFLHREVLGNTPDVWPTIDDPGVVSYVNRFNAIFQDWLRNREKQKAFRKVLVCVPRECGKTTIITNGAAIQAHLWDPDIRMFISSANDEMAVPMAEGIKAHWEGLRESSLLATKPDGRPGLFGTFKDPTGRRRWSGDFTTTLARRDMALREPTLRVFSVQTGGTSGHYNLGFLDDPISEEILKRFDPETWYLKCWSHYLSLQMVILKTGMLVVPLTRYGDGDFAGLIAQREVLPKATAVLGHVPEDFNEGENWIKYAHYADWEVIYEDGDPVGYGEDVPFPVVWSRHRMDAMRLTDEAFYSSQIRNRPAARKDNPVQQEHIDRWWITPEEVPPAAKNWAVMTCDWANKADDFAANKGDQSVIQVWGHEAGQIYLLNGWLGRATDEQMKEHWVRLMQWAHTQDVKIRLMTYDKPTGGAVGSLKGTFLQHAAIEGLRCPPILEITRGKKKDDRIMAAAYYVQSGMVHAVRGVPGSTQLAHQLIRGVYAQLKDAADAFADNFHEDVYRPSRRAAVSALPEKARDPEWKPATYESDGAPRHRSVFRGRALTARAVGWR